jgi:osmotically-inducible protein OsmY
MRRLWFGLSVGAAGLMLLGAAARADESSVGAETQADKNEEQQIRAQFAKTPDLENNRIDVKVDDGIAVLEGTVDSQREKKEAQRLAHVEGILGVNNRLQVRGAGK